MEKAKDPSPSETLPSGDSLDSWKEIAAYLKRGIRTVQRWEETEGLPVHRHRHDRLASVYALRSEIDEWKSRRTEGGGNANGGRNGAVGFHDWAPSASGPSGLAGFFARLRRPGSVPRWAALTVLSAIIAAAICVAIYFRPSQVTNLVYEYGEFSALDSDKRVLWKHSLPRIVRYNDLEPGLIVDADRDGRDEVLVCIGYHVSQSGIDNGEIVCFDSEGKALWKLSPNNTLRFSNTIYGPPWALANWSVYSTPSDRSIAISVHHFTLWPSMLILLNGSGQILARFVNSGWINYSQWMPRPSGLVLLAGGISNSRNMGMLAVLDAKNISGHSPEEAGSEYECRDCPQGTPMRYFVFPRSELNVATSSKYNGVNAIQVFEERFIVYTGEVEPQHSASNTLIVAVYEFSLDLELKRAYFEDRYWELHSKLEASGRIRHSKAACPDRDGPRLVRSWDPQGAWRDVKPGGNGPIVAMR